MLIQSSPAVIVLQSYVHDFIHSLQTKDLKQFVNRSGIIRLMKCSNTVETVLITAYMVSQND